MTIEDMQLLAPGSKLIVSREYWLRSKETGNVQIMTCKESNGQPYFGDFAYATKTVPLAYLNWDIVGPLPIRVPPDFDALIKQQGNSNV